MTNTHPRIGRRKRLALRRLALLHNQRRYLTGWYLTPRPGPVPEHP